MALDRGLPWLSSAALDDPLLLALLIDVDLPHAVPVVLAIVHQYPRLVNMALGRLLHKFAESASATQGRYSRAWARCHQQLALQCIAGILRDPFVHCGGDGGDGSAGDGPADSDRRNQALRRHAEAIEEGKLRVTHLMWGMRGQRSTDDEAVKHHLEYSSGSLAAGRALFNWDGVMQKLKVSC